MKNLKGIGLFAGLVGVIFMIAVGCSSDDPTPPNPPAPPVPPGKVLIGTPALAGMNYSWLPVDGLSDPYVAQPFAAPEKSTTYTLTVTSPCGSATSNVRVRVFQKDEAGELIEVL